MKAALPVVIFTVAVLARCASTPPHPVPVPTGRLDVQTTTGEHGTVPGAHVSVDDGYNAGLSCTADATGRCMLVGLKVPQSFTYCAEAEGYHRQCDPFENYAGDTNRTIRLTPSVPVPPPATLHGRLRVVNGYLADDLGPVRVYLVANVDLVHLERTRQHALMLERLDQARAAHAAAVRVFLQASISFDLNPTQVGYDAAVTTVFDEAAARGLYVEASVFPDAQILQPQTAQRTAVLTHVINTWGKHPAFVLEIANEPWQNGWSEADDPKLLDLARLARSLLGHQDFIVGDLHDGDDPDASAATVARARTLAPYSTMLAIHSSRKGNGYPDGTARLRRWVDHLESASDLLTAAPGHVLIHNEPMGAASVFQVPIAGRPPYEREADPEVMLIAWLTGEYTVRSFGYHRIAAQNDGVPGLDLIASILPRIPVNPACVYRNDSWSGSPSHGFTPTAAKVRWLVCGATAYGVAYGLNEQPRITMASGWTLGATYYQSPAAESGRFAESKVWVGEANNGAH